MILHDFRCLKCSAVFEQLVKEDQYPRCPICESDKVDRMLSPSSFNIKGLGAYKPGFNSKKVGK